LNPRISVKKISEQIPIKINNIRVNANANIISKIHVESSESAETANAVKNVAS